MNQTPQRPDSAELELLQHYRRHTAEQPSAELDARILAAAREAAASRRETRPGLFDRLRAWLFAGNPRTRWSVAFASLATIGLGLHTLEWPGEMDAVPMPRAPAPVSSYAAPPMPEERALSRRQLAEEAPAAPSMLAERQSAPAKMAPDVGDMAESSEAAGIAGSLADEQSEEQLRQALQKVLELRRQGDEQVAEQQLRLLQDRYPQRDLTAELERLAQEEAQKR
ncbi:hypothetical protein [Pseudomonas indica]|uniref:Uncharacterized protein n=1 Tax=Pseudomonas indica TaxID=137658 RepID=A0A1G9KQY0_9PSED|nr:hypothetical protein [Pseudomonas indica]SDL52052.1 hypothetical protein SAMN05216186_1239 [Pseudomonas indica]